MSAVEDETSGSSACYAFYVWVNSRPEFHRIINARSAGKAKYEYFIDISESWDIKFTELRVRKVGDCHSSDRFIHNAQYRGVPHVRCGDRVIVGEGRGVIIGHNDSANFDVLFDDDSPKYPGETLNVHPGEVEYA